MFLTSGILSTKLSPWAYPSKSYGIIPNSNSPQQLKLNIFLAVNVQFEKTENYITLENIWSTFLVVSGAKQPKKYIAGMYIQHQQYR